jgi:hypothetical protein
MYRFSNSRAEMKNDYSDANGLDYGLLSVDRWRDEITEIVSGQIDVFKLTPAQQDTLKIEINGILNALISKADSIMNSKQTTFSGKLKKFIVQTFVNEDKIREEVPEFSQTIIEQIQKPAAKNRLKILAKGKLQELAEETRDSLELQQTSAYDSILTKYHVKTLNDLNRLIGISSQRLQEKTKLLTYSIIATMMLFLVLWMLSKKIKALYTPLFILSVLLALSVLLTALFCPMIEIDARIKHMSFLLMGEHIEFNDQVLFYRSKSIVQVVRILIETGKADSIIVGVLILAFSIIFPILKLISTEIYLLGNERWKKSGIIHFFAFKSGKWSMADVMVVAIFMAYVGFNGILNNQLKNVNMDTHYIRSISTNLTSLQPAYILFVSFVLFGLILPEILKRITRLSGEKETQDNIG